MNNISNISLNANAALKAYGKAMQTQQQSQKAAQQSFERHMPTPREVPTFGNTVESSIDKVNELQKEKSSMIESFAAGEKQNVHELMIAMQKASLAMNMTTAVRSKVMQAYKEVMTMQF